MHLFNSLTFSVRRNISLQKVTSANRGRKLFMHWFDSTLDQFNKLERGTSKCVRSIVLRNALYDE